MIKEKKIKRDKNASIIYRGEDNSYYEKILATGDVKCIDEEIPFEIPQGWEWCRLVEVGKTETGTTPSKSHPEYFGDYIPFLGPANILNSKIVSVTQGLSDIGVDYGRIVPKNAILQVCIGGSIGKCAITDKPATFNQQINSITPYLCNVEFVHIVLQSEYFRQAIMDKATGTATPIINRGNWETLLFPLPPINEQKRIVANITELTHFIGIYSNKQEELNALNTNMYQRVKKAILQEAIQGKLVPQIAEEGTAHELLEQIKTEKQKLVKEGKLKKSALNDSVIFRGDDNKYCEKIGKSVQCIDEEIPFEIPESWVWCKFQDIANSELGKTMNKASDKGGEVPYLCSINVYWDKVDLSNVKVAPFSIAEKEKYLLQKGDLLICEGGEAGRCAIWSNDKTMYYQNALHRVRFYGNISSKFIQNVIRIYKTIGIIDKKSKGMTIKHFTKTALNSLYVPLPPVQEQQRIVAQIEKLFEQLR